MAGLLNFSGKGHVPVVRQTEAAECGLACLAMISSFHGHRIDLNTLRRRHPVSLKGVTLRALIQVASQMQLACRPVRFELDHLRQLNLPTIVHWDMNHFVVLKSVTRRGIVVHDPASGERSFPITEASKHLTGVALELSPAEGFLPKDERARLPFSTFWTQLRGSTHALAHILILSIVLEAFVIVSPLYLQLTVDEVITRGDADLLIVLALGFGLLTLIKVASTAIRSFILVIVQNVLHFQIGARLFHHLIRLPLTYFEKRHIGDILSRFTSIEPIRAALAEGMIAAAIDGLMALVDSGDDFRLQHPARARSAGGLCALRARASWALPSTARAQPGGDRDKGPRKLNVHRDYAGGSRPEDLQSRERPRDPVAQSLRRCGERQCPPWSHQDCIHKHQ